MIRALDLELEARPGRAGLKDASDTRSTSAFLGKAGLLSST
jgi:hypothetical protein